MKILYKIIFLTLLILSTNSTLFSQSNNCETATPLDLSSGNACFSGTNFNATSSLTTNACTPAPVNEVWFTYTVTGANNEFILTPGTLQNPVITVSSFGCASGTFDVCESGNGFNVISTTWGFSVGQQVLISVASNSLTDGTFELCVNSVAPDPAGGNTCTGAIPICDVSSSLVFNMSGLNSSGTLPGCFGGTVNQDAWLTFTVQESGLIEWAATASNTGTELDWAIYDVTSGCLGSIVACNYNYGGANGYSAGMSNTACIGCPTSGANASQCAEYCAPINVTAGNTYAIMIDLYSGVAGNITFQFTGGTTAVIAPNADFSISPTGVVCASDVTVSITDNSTGSPEWTFGDGTSYSGSNPPDHLYSTPGTYAITAVIGGECPTSHTEYIQLYGPVAATYDVTDETCLGDCDGTISLFPTGGSGTYNYAWADGPTLSSRVNLCADNYSVTITDPACATDIVLSIDVNDGSSSDASFSYDAASYCSTGSNPSAIISGDLGGVFTGSGTLVVDASTGTIDLAASGIGNYVVTYSVGGACPASVDFNIQITDGFDATFNYSGPYCATGTANIALAPGASAGAFSSNPAGLSLNTSTGAVDLGNSTPGIYTVTNFIVASNGCAEASHDASITINEIPTATISGGGEVCDTEVTPTVEIDFTGNASWDVSYSDGTSNFNETVVTSPFTISGGSAGDYTLISVTDANCPGTVSGSASIIINPTPVADAMSEIEQCAETLVQVPTFSSNPAGASFDWTNDNTNIGLGANGSGDVGDFNGQNNTSDPISGTITVTPTLNGCTGTSVQFEITVNPIPQPQLSAGAEYCDGDAISDLVSTQGSAGQIDWYDDAALSNWLGSGLTYQPSDNVGSVTYYITETANGCTSLPVSAIVTVNGLPVVDAGDDMQICSGESIVLEGISILSEPDEISYSWDFGVENGVAFVPSSGNNTYTVIGTDLNGCQNSDQINVNVTTSPNASLSGSPLNGFAPLDVTFTNNSSDAMSYTWNFGNGNTSNSSHSSVSEVYETGGTYIVYLIAYNGDCSDTTSITVVVDPFAPVEYVVPNVFTPNGDDVNDIFHFALVNAQAIDVTVINRWGNLVGEIKQVEDINGWDGVDIKSGKPVTEGVYFYRYTITDMAGEQITGHGHVTLVRQ